MIFASDFKSARSPSARKLSRCDIKNCLANSLSDLEISCCLEHNINKIASDCLLLPIKALIGSNKQSDAILLMLCSRQQEISKSDRELARQFLISQRLNFLADGLLADLKSEAKIIYK